MRVLHLFLISALTFATPVAAHEGHVHPESEEATSQEAQSEKDEAEVLVRQPAHDAASYSGGPPAPLRNLHPAVTHFPIGLLITAALAELLMLLRPSASLASASRVMAISGGAGAFVAAAFGWLHTGLWFGGDWVMNWHRWIGTGLGVAGPLIALIAWRAGENRNLLRGVLFVTALLLLWQGWLGGELSQGEGHLWM